MKHAWFWALAATWWSLHCGSGQAAEPVRHVLVLELGGSRLEAAPLGSFENQVYLLGRDGRVWSVDPRAARHAQRTTIAFRAYSIADMRRRLEAELGPGFEIHGTGHYLVALPRGRPDRWSRKFEELHRSFVHYFRVRGFQTQQPEFPLVAVVWPDQARFLQAAAAEGAQIGAGIVGYYSPLTNRISMYWQSEEEGGAAATESTIIHEATHQTAFNTGVHRRFGAAPRWLVEGLATMFEAPGVWDSRGHPRQRDRIHAAHLAAYRRLAADGLEAGSLARLIANDRWFDAEPADAYSLAWALSFYLVETRPRQYSRLLKITAAREAFTAYPDAERLADFAAAFGTDLRLLEQQFLKYMAGL